jgi:hypothetical protein
MKVLNMIKVIIAPSLIIIPFFSSNAFSEDPYSELTKPYDEKYRKLGIPYRKEFKDGVVYILPDTPQNSEDQNNKIGRDDFIEEEGRKRFDEAAKKMAKETGGTMMYIMEGYPKKNGEFDYFVLPEDKMLSGCTYPSGYTYPVSCSSEDGEDIFKAGIDPQSKLDEIARSQGKLSEYNKVPQGYDPDGCQIMPDGTERPCEETKVVDLISKGVKIEANEIAPLPNSPASLTD